MKVNLNHFDTIIFDFGGVILDIDPERSRQAFKKYMSDDLLDSVYESQLLSDFERGLISSEKLRGELEKLTSVFIDETNFNSAWNAMLLDYKPERIERIQELKHTHKLIMLSNTNEVHYLFFSNKLKEEYGVSFTDLFQKVYLSHEMELLKPDLEIYKRVLVEQKLNPERILFIEDTLENTIAAKKVGIQTLLIPRNGNFYDYFV